MSITTKRIQTFTQLGEIFKALSEEKAWTGYELGLNEEEYTNGIESIRSAVHYNGWFTPESVKKSLTAWAKSLSKENLENWLQPHNFSNSSSKKVGIIAAGNIPLVGFHDMISVLISGNHVKIKLSSKDTLLMMMTINYLKILEPSLDEQIEIVDGKLEEFDAVIATGSNNSARYFEYYFKNKPSIIRKNRTSVAILNGQESEEDLKKLGEDIFTYYGLGCRNVTKLYIPQNYDLDIFFRAIYAFKDIANHNKYANNYDYHRAVWLMNSAQLLENGFILLKEDASLVSPVGTLYYERYKTPSEVRNLLKEQTENIQCIVSSEDTPFGAAQKPSLSDYADGVNTLEFLLALQ